MAPVNGGVQRPLPRRRRPVAGRQPLETAAEAGRDLLDGQHPYPGRGELNGQWHAIKRPAERRYRRGIARPDGEAGNGRGSTVGEQLHRLVDGQVNGRQRAGRRGRQRRHLEDDLRRDAQRLAARRYHPQPRRARQQPLTQPRGRVDHLLAVVQRQQQPARRERGGERLDQRAAAFLHHPDGRCHPGYDEIGLLQVAKLDEPHPVGEIAA